MELELRKEHYAYYRQLPALCAAHEETAETILPEYCPDIARILNASGCLMLRGHEIADGRLKVSGVIRMTLLYIAEDAQGIRSFEYSVPLEHSFEERIEGGAGEFCLSGRLIASEVRLSNPRKLLSRLNAALQAIPYRAEMLSNCAEIREAETFRIETRCENRTLALNKYVKEKDFTYSGDFTISGNKEPVAEVLRAQVQPRVTEVRAIGKKIVMKGIIGVELLYRTESGACAHAAAELPFSQITEGESADGAELTPEASLRMTGVEVHIGSESAPEDSRTVSVRVYLCACLMLRETVSLCCITDLYSTSHALEAQTESVCLPDAPQEYNLEETVRETVETGVEVQSILCTDVAFGPAAVAEENGAAVIRTAAVIRMVYLDESGTALPAERRVELTVQAPFPAAELSVCEIRADDISASVVSGGIEVRAAAVFTVRRCTKQNCLFLCAVSAEEEKTAAPLPSLILRALGEGETLWDVAKQYRTTVQEILSANEWTEENVTPGTMLLIPRKRG